MALDTVQKCVAYARELLQDEKDTPYRYSDSSLVRALSIAFLEMKKLRPDLFVGITTPDFTANDTTAIPINEMYRPALVYYVAYVAQLRDDEEVTDQRAAAFRSLFAAQLTTVS